MAWTNPTGATVGVLATAAWANANIRDNMTFLKQAKLEHPYGDARHLESGFYHVASAVKNTRYSSAVTFTDSFTSNPIIAVSAWNNSDLDGANTTLPLPPAFAWIGGVTTDGFTIYLTNASNTDPSTIYVEWIAIGTD